MLPKLTFEIVLFEPQFKSGIQYCDFILFEYRSKRKREKIKGWRTEIKI